jgi:prepilin-type N-terminal cleavage/methylation domain-containing protein/prepilin-type processing-associated H-X9-DG protein
MSRPRNRTRSWGFTLLELPVASKQKRQAFTLVELLVVIGIIAILVGLLLPALNKARRQAYSAQCSNNMRQLALGVLQYSMNSHGVLMIMNLDANKCANGDYKDGFAWQHELTHQKYVAAPNMYVSPTDPASAISAPLGTIFRCPESSDVGQTGAGPTTGAPTDGSCAGYRVEPTTNPRADGQPAYGEATSYMLNGRANTAANRNGGANCTPFVWFYQTDTDPTGVGVEDAGYKRNLSMIHRSTQVVMILETTSLDWTVQQTTTTNGIYTNRVAARHGQKSSNGLNAYANFAFFDGHVELLSTASVCTANLKTNPGGIIAYLGSQ